MARLPGGRPFEEFLPCDGQVCKDNRGYITASLKATSFPGPAGRPRQKLGGKTRPRSAGTLYDEARIFSDMVPDQASSKGQRRRPGLCLLASCHRLSIMHLTILSLQECVRRWSESQLRLAGRSRRLQLTNGHRHMSCGKDVGRDRRGGAGSAELWCLPGWYLTGVPDRVSAPWLQQARSLAGLVVSHSYGEPTAVKKLAPCRRLSTMHLFVLSLQQCVRRWSESQRLAGRLGVRS